MHSGRLSQLQHELESLFGQYPDFVHRRNVELVPGEVPVFVFHTIEPKEFESQLQYLASNHYRALTLDEFLDTQAGRRQPGPREILMTFDDARSSFWFFGYPLLKKYSLPGTLFAITGWTPNETPRPNLDEVWAAKKTVAELNSLDPDDRKVCSWDELKVMHDSGIVCVDSHSHLHRRIFCDTSLAAVISPSNDFSPSNAVHSPYLVSEVSPLPLNPEPFVGLPLFGLRGFLEDGPAIRVKQEAVAEFQAGARTHLDAHDGRLTKGHLATLSRLIPPSACQPLPPTQLRR